LAHVSDRRAIYYAALNNTLLIKLNTYTDCCKVCGAGENTCPIPNVEHFKEFVFSSFYMTQEKNAIHDLLISGL
jgi:hypothetical protein